MKRLNTLIGKLLLLFFVPLCLLGLIEGLLRLAHIGLPTSFLLPASIQTIPSWVNNPFYGYRFFPPELARNPAPIAIEREKSPGLLRIVVLGESAAQGDPLLEFGPPRLLEKMLGAMDPSHPVEVVNAAMTAINSPIIADIARDMSKIRPDVVVLYIGNNEVIGPFGPGTVFTPLSRTVRFAALRARLTRLRLAQFLRFRTRKSLTSWAGLDMFAGLQFPEGDPRLEPMYKSYRYNLESIIRSCRRSGARVLLATVAVNLADCAPFGSEAPDSLSAEQRTTWQTAFEAGQSAQTCSNWPAARQSYQTAMSLFDRHAALVYRLAQVELATGQPEAARPLFQRARDLDTQRFRADSRLNDIVRATARDFQVELVDVDTAFNQIAADQGTPGQNLFLDHVHFTFEGTWQIAAAFASRIAGPDAPPPPDLEEARRLMFFTPQAERQQAAIMRERRRRPPFKDQNGNDRQVARLYELDARCAARIGSTPLATLEIQFQALSAANPRDFFLPFQWGGILAANQRWAEAAPLFVAGLQLVPHHFETRVLPAIALARTGQPENAAALVVGPSGPYGRYLAENTLAVMRALEADGQIDAAQLFRKKVLHLAPRFSLRPAIQAYPLGRPKP